MISHARIAISSLIRPFAELYRRKATELLPFVAIAILLYLARGILIEGLHTYIDSVKHKLDLTLEMQYRLESFARMLIDMLAVAMILPTALVPQSLGNDFEFLASVKLLPKTIGASVQSTLLALLKLRLYVVLILAVLSISIIANFLDGLPLDVAAAVIICLACYALIGVITAPFMAVITCLKGATKHHPIAANSLQRLQLLALLALTALIASIGAIYLPYLSFWAAHALALIVAWYCLALFSGVIVSIAQLAQKA